MKTILHFFRNLLPASLLLLAAGCGTEFVNLTPQDVIPVAGFYKTEADIRAALTGTYGNLRGIYNNFWQFTEMPSDNTRSFGESEVALGEFDRLTWRSTTGGVSTAWTDAYRTIANANVVIERSGAVTMTDALRNQYMGEAKFLRALMYFNLVRLFGDVPLILTEIKTEADAYTFKREATAAVYAQIEKDLLDAEKVLPAKFTGVNIGRATSGAAKSLLGKAYLQQKKWTEAAAKLAEVIAANTYRILPAYTDVFGLGKDNNDEIVFAVQYVGGGFGEGNTFVHNFAPQPSGTSIVAVTANSHNVGTRDLYDAFGPGDIRRDAFMGIFTRNPDVYYWTKKFVYNIAQQNEGENDWPVIRYADVVLMYAEALNNNGKTDAALTQLHLTRKRAGLPELKGLTKADTQLAVELERRLELCFEGHRWHDLIRWGKEVSTMQAFKAKYATIDVLNANISITADRKLFPIPFRETSLNASLVQNPGY